MALILVVIVFALVSLLAPAARGILGGVPQMVRTLVVAILQVVFMTYLITPRVTRRLARWLFRQQAAWQEQPRRQTSRAARSRTGAG